MKLNKFKFGSILAVVLSLAILAAVSPAVNAKTWEIDTDEFTQIEDGGSLSNYNNGDISAGDTLVLTDTAESYTQTGSSTIEVDVRNVTIKGRDTGDNYPVIERTGTISGGQQNFLIKAEGVTVKNLRFEVTTSDVNYPAIVVDLSNTCSCTSPTAKFKNLIIPTCGSGGSYDEGILFTGDTDYQNVVFENLTIGSNVSDYGIHFDKKTGDVSALEFSEMDINGCGTGGGTGTGILFENGGTLEDVEITESHDEYGVQDNNYGIMVDGSKVTEIADFNLKNVELKNNSNVGLLIKDSSTGSDNLKTIKRLKLERENTEISGNGRGVIISDGTLDDPSRIDANLTEVDFEDVVIKNNTDGGVGMYVDGVGYPGTEGSGIKVADSEFNPQAPDQNNNDQLYGLKVKTRGGIQYVDIVNSEFHGHTGSEAGLHLKAESNLQNITIENSSASYNAKGSGVDLEGNFVSGVKVEFTGGQGIHFKENGSYGIHVQGSIGVDGFQLVDKDGDGNKDISLDENGNTGLKIENSNRGNLSDITVKYVTFNENSGHGAHLLTDQSGNIHGVSFHNISAKENNQQEVGSSGLKIEAAQSFENSTDKILLKDSKLNSNKSHGIHLKAKKHLQNTIIQGSSFVDNNSSGSSTGTGIKLDAGIDVGDELAGTVVKDNVVTGNHYGITLHGWKIANLDVNQNDQILNNGTYNVKIKAIDTLQYVDVKDNILINEIGSGEFGLHLSVDEDGASSNITVSGNSFESGITDYCGGAGTGIYLNAKNVKVKENKFYRLDPAIKVLQEAAGPVDNSDESKNHINKNNFEICCTAIDATSLNTGQKVDATDNFWGEGETKESIEKVIDAPEHVFYGDLRNNQVVIVSLLEVTSLKAVQDEPKVNETVDLEYKLKNVSDKTISGQDVRLTIKNPSGNVVVNIPKEDIPELDAGATYTKTHSFVPIKEGTYSATLEVDGGAYSKTTTFDVQGEPGPTPTPDKFEPNWEKTGIMPAPLDGSTPELEITSKEVGAIEDADVSDFKIRVFDLSGKKVIPADSFGDSINDLAVLNDLQNGLYIYTVSLTRSDGKEFISPAMKFVVKK